MTILTLSFVVYVAERSEAPLHDVIMNVMINISICLKIPITQLQDKVSTHKRQVAGARGATPRGVRFPGTIKSRSTRLNRF